MEVGSQLWKRRKCVYNMYMQKNKMEMDWNFMADKLFPWQIKMF